MGVIVMSASEKGDILLFPVSGLSNQKRLTEKVECPLIRGLLSLSDIDANLPDR